MQRLSNVERTVLAFCKRRKNQNGHLGGIHPLTASGALGLNLDSVTVAMVNLDKAGLVTYHDSADPYSCMVIDITEQGWNTDAKAS